MSDESAKSITSEELYLDEIVVILRRMEVALEDIAESAATHAFLSLPFWRRWAASWRHASATLDADLASVDQEP